MATPKLLYQAVKTGAIDVNSLSPSDASTLSKYMNSLSVKKPAPTKPTAPAKQTVLSAKFGDYQTPAQRLGANKKQGATKTGAIAASVGNAATLGIAKAMESKAGKQAVIAQQKKTVATIPARNELQAGRAVQLGIKKPTIIKKPAAPISAGTVGEAIGSILPYAGAEKAISKIPAVAKIASPILKSAITGAGAGASVGGTQAAVRGEKVAGIAKEATLGGLLGGGANVSLGLLNKILGKGNISPAVGNVTKEKPAIPTTKEIPQTDMAVAFQKAQAKKINPIKTQNVTQGLASKTVPEIKQKPVDNISLNKLNEIKNPSATQKPTDNISLNALNGMKTIPEKGMKERKFFRSTIESPLVPDEVKTLLEKEMPHYMPETNKEQLASAATKIKDGTAKAEWADVYAKASGKELNGHQVALGESLMADALKRNDYHAFTQHATELAEKLTDAGRAVQAASLISKFKPEGMALYAQRLMQRANRGLPEGKQKQFTPNEIKTITDKMQEAYPLPDKVQDPKSLDDPNALIDNPQKKQLINETLQFIADKMPSNAQKKIRALQMLAMLFNPKTHGRNIYGNVLLTGAENIKDIPASLADMAVSKLRGTDRTTFMPSKEGIETQLQGAKQGLSSAYKEARTGITQTPTGQYEIPRSNKIFDEKKRLGRMTNKLIAINSGVLKMGDAPGYQAAYNETLRQLKKGSKDGVVTKEMIAKAEDVAKQRTLQDVNAITDGFVSIKKGLNKLLSYKGFGLGDVALPFTGATGSLMKRSLEYSPIGILDAVRIATKGKDFDQKAFVDAIGRSVTGTAGILLGYDLAKHGIITGAADTNKVVASYQKEVGKQPYSWNVNGTWRSFDWAQPVSSSLAIGADVYAKGQKRKDAVNVVKDAITSGGNSLLKQTLYQGLNKLFSGYEGAMGGLTETAAGMPSQFAPTLGKQIAQVLDPYQRETYNDAFLANVKGQIQGKLPVLKGQLPLKYGTMGEPLKTYQSKGAERMYDIFLNPGMTAHEKHTPAIDMINKIYESTGETGIIPKVAPNSVTVKGKDVILTPAQKSKYQQLLGKKTMQEYNKIAKDDPEILFTKRKTVPGTNNKFTYKYYKNFSKYSNEDKAAILAKKLTDISSEVKEEMFP